MPYCTGSLPVDDERVLGVESEVGKGSTFTVRVPVNYKESDQ